MQTSQLRNKQVIMDPKNYIIDHSYQAAFFFVSLYPSYEEISEPQRKATTLLHILSLHSSSLFLHSGALDA